MVPYLHVYMTDFFLSWAKNLLMVFGLTVVFKEVDNAQLIPLQKWFMAF